MCFSFSTLVILGLSRGTEINHRSAIASLQHFRKKAWLKKLLPEHGWDLTRNLQLSGEIWNWVLILWNGLHSFIVWSVMFMLFFLTKWFLKQIKSLYFSEKMLIIEYMESRCNFSYIKAIRKRPGILTISLSSWLLGHLFCSFIWPDWLGEEWHTSFSTHTSLAVRANKRDSDGFKYAALVFSVLP